MTEGYYAGCYWLGRQETIEACAVRAAELFRRVALYEPTWARWHETGRSFEKARQRMVPTDPEGLQKVLGKKKNRIGDDGFYYWLWAGDHSEETSVFSGLCGSADVLPPSSCVFMPPGRGALSDRILNAEALTRILRSMALAWDPEWGIATSHQHRDTAYTKPPGGAFVGWINYFSRQRGTVPPLPAPVRVEPVEDKGTLVILTPERFTVSNPDHVALAARVHELLDHAGLLYPLRRPDAPGSTGP